MSSLELIPTGNTQIEVHGFSEQQQQALQEALPTSLIRERKGPSGRMLKYISGKTSIDAANRIFGFGKWGYRVLSKSHEKCGDSEYYTADIELFVIGCPFPFPGEGVGVVTSNNVEGHEKARKEAVTDAMKRALRHFGDQFGLCLYSEDALVEDAQGNLVQIKDMHSQQNGKQQAQAPKKVVDAANSTPQPKNPVDELKREAMAAKFITGKNAEELLKAWKDRLRAVFQRDVTDDDLLESEALRATLRAAIERYIKRNAEAATSGK